MTIFPHHLYHGTSGHLLLLIEEHGLGGRNLMAEWRVMDFLRLAFPVLRYDPYNFNDADHEIKSKIRKTLEDGGGAGMNFEYGDLYATGGYARAARYAGYGPELIDFVRKSLEIADGYGVSDVRGALEDFPEIAEFVGKPQSPVVLKLPLLPKSVLEKEKGGSVDFDFITDPNHIDAILPQWSFRVKAVIPFSDIEVLEAYAAQD